MRVWYRYYWATALEERSRARLSLEINEALQTKTYYASALATRLHAFSQFERNCLSDCLSATQSVNRSVSFSISIEELQYDPSNTISYPPKSLEPALLSARQPLFRLYPHIYAPHCNVIVTPTLTSFVQNHTLSAKHALTLSPARRPTPPQPPFQFSRGSSRTTRIFHITTNRATLQKRCGCLLANLKFRVGSLS